MRGGRRRVCGFPPTGSQRGSRRRRRAVGAGGAHGPRQGAQVAGGGRGWGWAWVWVWWVFTRHASCTASVPSRDPTPNATETGTTARDPVGTAAAERRGLGLLCVFAMFHVRQHWHRGWAHAFYLFPRSTLLQRLTNKSTGAPVSAQPHLTAHARPSPPPLVSPYYLACLLVAASVLRLR